MISNTQKNLMLDTLDGCYLSLHTGDPGTTGANEVTGGGYARAAENLGPSSGGIKTNDSETQFPDMPAVTVTHFGAFDAPSGGNFLWGSELVAPITMTGGATFRFNTGKLSFVLI